MAIETSPFSEAFGPKAQRKRVKLDVNSIVDLAEGTEKSLDTYQDRLEQALLLSGNSGAGDMQTEEMDPLSLATEPIFNKGQSKRIFNEL
jgi:nuclear GTP-binding protein